MSGFAKEALLHWGAVAFYVTGMVLFVHVVLFDRPQRVRWALWATGLGLVPH